MRDEQKFLLTPQQIIHLLGGEFEVIDYFYESLSDQGVKYITTTSDDLHIIKGILKDDIGVEMLKDRDATGLMFVDKYYDDDSVLFDIREDPDGWEVIKQWICDAYEVYSL